MLTVIQAIRTKGQNTPFAPAVLNGPRILPYGEMLKFIARLSNHLVDQGVAPGSRVFFNIQDPDVRLIAALACFHAGLVPLWIGEPGELRKGRDIDLVLATMPLSSPEIGADIWLDGSAFAGSLSDESLRDLPDRGDEEILFLAGTSGTTGQRKLVVERRGAFEFRQRGYENFRVDEADRVLVTLGDATKFGFSYSLNLLSRGATLVRSGLAAERVLKALVQHGVSRMLTTPALLGKLFDLMERDNVRVPSLKYIMLTGSLFQASLVQRASKMFLGSMMISYGSAEVGAISSGRIDPKTFQVGYVGELRESVELVNPGTAEAPAPLVLANRRGVFTEYYSDGKVSQSVGESYRMPDIGYLRGTSLFLVGRDDETLNFSGNKIAFSRIERALRQSKDLENADIGIVPAPADWGADIVIAIAGRAADPHALAQSLASAIGHPAAAPHMHFVELTAVPRNQMGKVDRSAVLDAYLASKKQ